MRSLLASLAALGLLCAEGQAADGTKVAALQPTPEPHAAGLAPLMVVELLARRLRALDPQAEQSWLNQLAAMYAAPHARLLWVDHLGPTARARVVLDEITRADEYALDPAHFQVSLPAAGSNPEALIAAEIQMSLAVTRYAWHARGGRLEPEKLSLWLDYKPKTLNAAQLVSRIAGAEDPAAALRALHPRHIQFETLRQAYLKERGGTSASGRPGFDIPMGVRIKPGRRHPDVTLARLKLGKPAADGDDTLLDSELQNDLFHFMNTVAGIHYGRNRGIDDDVRVALNGGSQGSTRGMLELIRANMERWRWLPAELGELYVWNNLPEYETRVVKSGAIIHSERIIIGQPSTQTPVFSDEILRVIVNPDWTIPESIKLSTIWPSLRGGDYGVLRRRNMRIVHEGKEINPSKLRYADLNARDVPIVMGAGPANPLGRFKFVFPNKHDVYMHDTTSKGLFASRERTFSHGCIRVKNPQRFAEVLLAEAKGWNAADLAWQTRSKATVRIELDRKVPVHNTYFTLVADTSGQLKKLPDVYGHDKRITDALNGVDVAKIAATDPALAQKKRNEDLASSAIAPPQPVRRAAPRPKPQVAATSKPRSSFFATYGRPSFAGRTRRDTRPKGFFFLW